jgi:hypothetical protein
MVRLISTTAMMMTAIAMAETVLCFLRPVMHVEMN